MFEEEEDAGSGCGGEGTTERGGREDRGTEEGHVGL